MSDRARRSSLTRQRAALTRPAPRRSVLRAECLENRALPAAFADLGVILDLNLNTAGESVAVVATGAGYELSLTGGTWAGTDSARVSGNGSATLTVTAVGVATFTGGVAVADSAPGAGVVFADSGASGYANPFAVTLDDDSAGVAFSGASSFGAFALRVEADRGVVLNPGAAVATTSGTVTLISNKAAAATAVADGIVVNGASILSATGDITLDGTGGATASGNHGVRITAGAVVRSTGTGEDAASITITGVGGPGADGNAGVEVSGAGTLVTTAAGDVTVTGRGGAASGQFNDGVAVSGGASIRSTDGGPGAGRLTITGTGGNGTSGNRGVALDGAASGVFSTAGAVEITGAGGTALADGNHGVVVGNAASVASLGFGAAATITIAGTGGTGSGFNRGVSIEQGAAEVRSFDGDISITGTGGVSTSTFNEGVYVGLTGRVLSSGTGADAAAVTITGSGGSGNGGNRGVVIEATSSFVSSVDGDITVTGTGGFGGGGNPGVLLNGGGRILSTGTTAGAARVTVVGAGGIGADFNRGVDVEGAGSGITSVAGDVTVTGTGSQSGAGFNEGVYVSAGGSISSTGAGDLAAAITITGTGGVGTGGNRGVTVEAGGANVTSVDGDITVTGVAGTGSDPIGVLLFQSGAVRSTGAGAGAARITISGTAPDFGTFVAGGVVSTRDGALVITGVATAAAGQVGFEANSGGVVTSTGSGAVSVTGTSAGAGSGLRVVVGGQVTATGGAPVTLTGVTAGGTDVTVSSSTVNSGAGNLTLTGDTVTFSGATSIGGSGTLTLRPRTGATTIGLGGAAGTFNLSDAELAALTDGFAAIVIGDAAGTGAVTVRTATFRDPVSVVSGGVVDDASDAGADVTAPALTLAGLLAPGLSPGVFSVAGALALGAGSPLAIEVAGPTPGTGYSQIVVAGGLDLNGAVLTLSGAYVPTPGETFTVADNDGVDPVAGTFAALPEGAVTTLNGVPLRVSYVGGTGNDVTLTALATVSAGDVTELEGNPGTTVFTFTVSLSAASTQTVTVDFATADGTALVWQDYAAATGTLTFAPGVTTRTVTVMVLRDRVFEADQTFTLNLSGPTNAVIGDGQGVGTILNDDVPPTLSINNPMVIEGAGTVTFTVTRTGATEFPVSVSYATADGTAVSAAAGPGTPDYVATAGTLTFAPSVLTQETQTFAVEITDDAVYEWTGQFTVTLSGATGATVATATGTATVVDNEPLPTISIENVTADEGAGVAVFTVTRTGASAQPVEVNYASLDGSARTTEGPPGTPDYVSASGTLVFAPSASATETLTISVPILDDTTDEPDEQFTMNLSLPIGPTGGATLADDRARALIVDNDAAPTVSVDGMTRAEGNGGTTAFTFTITLSAPSAWLVTVGYTTADGTAQAGTDYRADAGTLQFLTGRTTLYVTVLATGDTVFEADQTFTLDLSSPTNATLAVGQGVGTITNDDVVPTLSINDVTASEAAGTLTFTVTRTGATEVPITANYLTGSVAPFPPGTAVPGSDFGTASGTLTFAPSLAAGITETFTVALVNDTADEPDETFPAGLLGATGATIADADGTATILDDDLPLAAADNATTPEDVSLTGPSVLGNDDAIPGSVAELVGAGATNGTLALSSDGTFTYAPDADFNGTDSFQYQVRNPAGEVSNTATVTITVTAVNDAPSFAAGPDVTVGRGAAAAVPGWATGVTAGPANEAGQSLAFLVITDNPTLFAAVPAVDPATGTLTFTPAAFAYGTAVVTLRLADDGGGADTSAAQTFTITVHKHPTESRAVGQDEVARFAVGADAGGPGTVTVYGPGGGVVSATDPFPGTPGGVRTAVADFTGDGVPDLAVGSGPGAVARVKVLDGATGAVLFDDRPFADFAGGVFVAAGDVDGDGRADLVVTPDQSGGPRVDVFRGGPFTRMASFFGIDDPNFRGGARAAAGDVTGDGVADLVVSAGFGGGPRVSVYDGAALARGLRVHPVNDFFLFEPALRNGAYVAVGDVDGDGLGDVIGGGGPGGGPRVLAISGATLLAAGAGAALDRPLANFFAGDVSNRGGVRVAAKDLDGDRRADVVAGAGSGGGSRVTGYLGKDFGGGSAPEAFGFDAFPGLTHGVFVG